MYTILLNTAELMGLFQTTPYTDGTHSHGTSGVYRMPGALDRDPPKSGKVGRPFPNKCILISEFSGFFAVVHATTPLHPEFVLWPPSGKSKSALDRAREIVEAQKWTIGENGEGPEDDDSVESEGEEDGGVSIGGHGAITQAELCNSKAAALPGI